MATTQSNKTYANVTTEGNYVRDVSDVLWHIDEPTAYPLQSLVGGKLYLDGKDTPQEVKGIIKKEVADQPKYSVIEKSVLDRTYTTNGAVADTTTTTVTLDSNVGLRIGDQLYNRASGEMIHVTAVDSGGADITVKRNLGSTAFTVADDSIWYQSSCAYAEGTAKATLNSQLAAERERRLQIFKRSFGVSGTAMNSLVEAGKNKDGTGDDSAVWTEEMMQAVVNFKLDIENAFWFGPNADSTTNAAGATVNLTRGVIAEIDNYSTTTLRLKPGTLTLDALLGEVSEEVFRYGPRRKRAFCDANFRSAVDKIAKDHMRSNNKETAYGLMVSEFETSHGILELYSCGNFAEHLGDSKAGFCVVLDTERVVYKYLENRDSKYEINIQTPGTDAKEGQYIGEVGLSLRSLPHHRIIQTYAD